MQTLEQLKRHVLAPQPGFLYEPRAFWDTNSQTVEPGDRPDNVQFDSDNFYNGSKYPIVLTGITFEPALGLIQESMSLRGLLDGRVRIASSGNQYLTRDGVPLRMLLGEQSYEPPSPYAATPNLGGGFVPQTGLWGPYLGPLWGVSGWDFHHPLMLPKDGAVSFSLGSRITMSAVDIGVVAELQFFETGDSGNDFFKGNTRAFRVPFIEYTANAGPWSLPVGGGKAPGATPVWPPQGTLTGTAFRRQGASSAGSSQLRGFSLMVDQRAYDDVSSGFAPNPANSAFASVANAIPVRVQTSGCGTQEAWWRDGAPLSLVSPTRGPALTGKLPVPITLQPGDGLDVEMLFDSVAVTREATFFDPELSGLSIGLSFTGFAAIEN